MAKSKETKAIPQKKSKAVLDDDDLVADDAPPSKTRPKTSMDKKTKYVTEEDDGPPSKTKSKTGTDKKTKHVDDDELDDLEESEEIADAEEEETQIKADDDADAQPPEVAEESVDEGPKPPKAKLSKLAIVLILLNWIVMPTFFVLAYLDTTVRTQYAYRATLNYIQIWGLPLKSEEDFPSAANETRPRQRMSPDQLSDAVKQRTRKSFKDFQPVEETIEKPLPFRLRPSDMATDYLKRDVFLGIPDPVATLDEAIEKLQSSVPAAIKAAADEVVAKHKDKKDDEKRAVAANIMLPIAWNVGQIRKLNDKLEKTTGKDLDAALEDAAQRRMYYDLLAPINIYNPGEIDDFKNYKIEKITFEEYDLEKIKGFLSERLAAAIAANYDSKVDLGKFRDEAVVQVANPEAAKRDSVEKRHKIGFILFALSQVSVPTVDRKLVKQGVERAQVISGLNEFTEASINYVRTKRILEERIIAAIIADREGELVMVEGKLTRTQGFIDEYDSKVDRLVKMAEHLDTAQKRLADLKVKHDEFQKIYVQRLDQYRKALDELLESRKATANLANDLRALQEQLHRAYVELSDAADENFRLYNEIYRLEMGKKGGKK